MKSGENWRAGSKKRTFKDFIHAQSRQGLILSGDKSLIANSKVYYFYFFNPTL